MELSKSICLECGLISFLIRQGFIWYSA